MFIQSNWWSRCCFHTEILDLHIILTGYKPSSFGTLGVQWSGKYYFEFKIVTAAVIGVVDLAWSEI